MMTRAQQKIVDSVSRFNEIRDARTCAACGGQKSKGYPMCFACLRALPEAVRRELYQPADGALDDIINRAVAHIQEHGNGKQITGTAGQGRRALPQ